MLPGLRIVKRLEQQNKKNNKLQCSLANWLFLAEASKNDKTSEDTTITVKFKSCNSDYAFHTSGQTDP